MRIFFLLLKLAVFMLLLDFAVKNTDSVVVRYFLGFEWQVPLVVLLLVFFGAGLLLGVLACLAIMARQRSQIFGLRRELRSRARAVAAPATAEAV